MILKHWRLTLNHFHFVGTFGLDFRCFRYVSMLALASAPLTYLIHFLKDIDAFGHTISVSKITLWTGLQVCGFGYVSGVTERRHPLLSRFGNFSEIAKILLLSPIIYTLGPIYTMSGGCIYLPLTYQLSNPVVLLS